MTKIVSPKAYAEMAALVWQNMDDNERHGVRFGLFPANKMKVAEDAGYNGLQLCVALMNVAKANGGMIA